MSTAAYFIPAVAIALSLVSCGQSSSKSEPEARSQVITVDVAEPENRAVTLYHTYPGSLHANSAIDLVARVSGYLRALSYESGDIVEKGTLLFTIEDTQYRDAAEQARSQLISARSSLDYNTSHYEAVKQAAAADAASTMEVDQARSAMESSRQAVKNAEAALSTAETNLQYCYVRAPFRGRVSASVPGVGAFLTGNGERLATIYDDSQVRADFYIDDSRYMTLLRDRDSTLISALDEMPVAFGDSLPHSYTAKLIYISPGVDPSTGTLELRAMIDNKYGELKDGMYATVKLPYDYLKDALLVKDASISTDQRGKYLYLVNDSDKVVYTPIEVGDIVDDSLRVVTKGLRPGDRYVTRALLKVRPGMSVNPRPVQ